VDQGLVLLYCVSAVLGLLRLEPKSWVVSVVALSFRTLTFVGTLT